MEGVFLDGEQRICTCIKALGEADWNIPSNNQVGSTTPKFDKMEGNPICRQIPWSYEHDVHMAWHDAKTGCYEPFAACKSVPQV